MIGAACSWKKRLSLRLQQRAGGMARSQGREQRMLFGTDDLGRAQGGEELLADDIAAIAPFAERHDWPTESSARRRAGRRHRACLPECGRSPASGRAAPRFADGRRRHRRRRTSRGRFWPRPAADCGRSRRRPTPAAPPATTRPSRSDCRHTEFAADQPRYLPPRQAGSPNYRSWCTPQQRERKRYGQTCPLSTAQRHLCEIVAH